MNLFLLSHNPGEAAWMLNDTHVRKMILETAQILDHSCYPCFTNAHPGKVWEPIAPLPRSHWDNPVVRSARNQLVFNWAYYHLKVLLSVYDDRFGKPHAYTKAEVPRRIGERRNSLPWPEKAVSGFYCATDTARRGQYHELKRLIPEYREYYARTKRTYGKTQKLSTWTWDEPPLWFTAYWAERGHTLHQKLNKRGIITYMVGPENGT